MLILLYFYDPVAHITLSFDILVYMIDIIRNHEISGHPRKEDYLRLSTVSVLPHLSLILSENRGIQNGCKKVRKLRSAYFNCGEEDIVRVSFRDYQEGYFSFEIRIGLFGSIVIFRV